MGPRILGGYRAVLKRHTKQDIRNQKHESQSSQLCWRCRMIAAKLSTFMINERILAEAKKKKREGIKVYEGFLKAMVKIRKKNWEEVGSENKYAILVYDRICTTG